MPVTRPAAESLASRLVREPLLPARVVLDIVGQVGFSLQTLHDQGRAHGGVSADAVALHDDGSVSLESAPPSVIATPTAMAADLAALGRLARSALGEDADPATQGFLDRLADPPRGTTPDAGDVARTALAMASGPLTAASSAVPLPSPQPAAVDHATDPEQRRVRNRFIGVGAVVVLVGLVLLKACGGGGQAVPNVTGDTYPAAVKTLHSHGFVARRQPKTAAAGQQAGTVVAQFPAAGTRPRAGATVTLTVAR